MTIIVIEVDQRASAQAIEEARKLFEGDELLNAMRILLEDPRMKAVPDDLKVEFHEYSQDEVADHTAELNALRDENPELIEELAKAPATHWVLLQANSLDADNVTFRLEADNSLVFWEFGAVV